MRRFTATFIFLACAGVAPSTALADEPQIVVAPDAYPEGTLRDLPPLSRSEAMQRLMRTRLTWNAMLEGGFGLALIDPVKAWTFARAGAGAVFVRDPGFYSLLATYEVNPQSYRTFGVLAEATAAESGFFIQIGGTSDTEGRLGGTFSIGQGTFGVEAQVRNTEDRSIVWAGFLKFRAPIGLLVHAIVADRETSPK